VPDKSLFANDLEPVAAALCPAISILQSRLEAAGALATGMSGSGATVFGLFGDEGAAGKACGELQVSNAGAPAWARVAKTLASR
jgi:4-diphosphocytidyl-2-C-methyl-D-erythritol kinase